MNEKKIYILDTNVLVHDPEALYNFADVEIGIPLMVLEELDKFKAEGTDRGRNSREVIRNLDALRERGSLGKGVRLDNNAIIRVLFLEKGRPSPFELEKLMDNEILLIALEAKEKGYFVKFISKDINARVKADAIGIVAEDYLHEYISQEEFYHGWRTIAVPSIQLKREYPQILETIPSDYSLNLNEFVVLTSQNNPYNYKIYRYLGEKNFKYVTEPYLNWPLKARNVQQLMALDLLFDHAIQFVALLGPAGTGKTFLALLAGLHQVVVHDEYERFLISRPVIPLGRDIGFLPGDIQEKLHHWMLPIYDNMEFIRHSVITQEHLEEIENEQQKKHKKFGFRKRERAGMLSLDELIHRGKISLEAITYMRGRSIPYQYILIDEAQNLTPHEVKTIISRVGEGSKIILAGDPYQIDSPYLNFSSNGLILASEKFKGQSLFGAVFLPTSERSKLSELASRLL